MKKILLILGGLLVLGAAYYAISPLFRNIKTDEALPSAKIQVDMASEPMQEKAMKKKAGEIIGTPAHPASGEVYIVEAEGKKYVRYENLKTINGPDIYVYLSKDKEAKDFVSLGKVRATEGNVNYEIPANVNPSDYPYVLTWCKQFGVLFNSAELQ